VKVGAGKAVFFFGCKWNHIYMQNMKLYDNLKANSALCPMEWSTQSAGLYHYHYVPRFYLSKWYA